MNIDESIQTTLANARTLLLQSRNAQGHWEGELSSSALSTGTALFALHLHSSDSHKHLVSAGIRWLIDHQNEDGGWGDTIKSISNISTTALCWAALSVAPSESRDAISSCEQWLAKAAGSLEPSALAQAIAARYGKDRTFSVPILTMCALAGRLGDDKQAWRHIPQLPFELAAFPQSWYRFFRLPVVSYALPALISMGLVRHVHRPTRNPIARLARWLTRSRVLNVLTSIQPIGGGFLEATPLTSFVAMSMIGAGLIDHPVVAHCVEFLIRSARPDGSWPIDTNLATWVTTLSINALTAGGEQPLADSDRAGLRTWLLNQQYNTRHPYTGAPPGAWAWTDLPGGVPDADDTAGALLALHNLAYTGAEQPRDLGGMGNGTPLPVALTEESRANKFAHATQPRIAHSHSGDIDDATTRAAEQAITWLLDLQNSDGGIPTFCRGWTNLPFDRSGPDLTAHALLAWYAWREKMPPRMASRIERASSRALEYLAAHQRADGSWLPLWFGNQHAHDDENPTYGTAKVLLALLKIAPAQEQTVRGVQWLIANQNEDGGWGGGRGTPSSIEETALAIEALSLLTAADARPLIVRGCEWLVGATKDGREFPASPIGFYFAKLWYYERLYPVLTTVGGLSRATNQLSHAPG